MRAKLKATIAHIEEEEAQAREAYRTFLVENDMSSEDSDVYSDSS